MRDLFGFLFALILPFLPNWLAAPTMDLAAIGSQAAVQVAYAAQLRDPTAAPLPAPQVRPVSLPAPASPAKLDAQPNAPTKPTPVSVKKAPPLVTYATCSGRSCRRGFLRWRR